MAHTMAHTAVCRGMFEKRLRAHINITPTVKCKMYAIAIVNSNFWVTIAISQLNVLSLRVQQANKFEFFVRSYAAYPHIPFLEQLSTRFLRLSTYPQTIVLPSYIEYALRSLRYEHVRVKSWRSELC